MKKIIKIIHLRHSIARVYIRANDFTEMENGLRCRRIEEDKTSGRQNKWTSNGDIFLRNRYLYVYTYVEWTWLEKGANVRERSPWRVKVEMVPWPCPSTTSSNITSTNRLSVRSRTFLGIQRMSCSSRWKDNYAFRISDSSDILFVAFIAYATSKRVADSTLIVYLLDEIDERSATRRK